MPARRQRAFARDHLLEALAQRALTRWRDGWAGIARRSSANSAAIISMTATFRSSMATAVSLRKAARMDGGHGQRKLVRDPGLRDQAERCLRSGWADRITGASPDPDQSRRMSRRGCRHREDFLGCSQYIISPAKIEAYYGVRRENSPSASDPTARRAPAIATPVNQPDAPPRGASRPAIPLSRRS